MIRRRTIYFNDARHSYLFVFEPPMKLEDAWRPIDECAGTAVDTFAYGVERGDGLFYPSNVGKRFKYGEHHTEFRQAAYWRLWHNMQSLIDRGLDPLTVLIDRAHEKGMDFIASLRLHSYLNMAPALQNHRQLGSGGRGYIHAEVRDHQFAVLEELATEYSTEGVELDFVPGMSVYFTPEDVEEGKLVMTEWVRKVSGMVRSRPGGAGVVGARVYPTESMNLAAGLDVRTWLQEGFLDYVTPMIYSYMLLDTNMPIDWLIEAAHAADTSVYPLIHPFSQEGDRTERAYATPAMMRAAAANYWERGADGMYTWFLHWPFGDGERNILTELGDPELAKEGDKHYVLTRRGKTLEELDYETPLPVEIASSDRGTRHGIPFYIADDIQGKAGEIRQVLLRLNIRDLVSADRLALLLNGQSLAGETCLRSSSDPIAPYMGQWLELHLRDVRPQKGQNLLEVSLDRRAEGLMSPLVVEDAEIIVEYGPYPSRLGPKP
jgi:hypothetical protein